MNFRRDDRMNNVINRIEQREQPIANSQSIIAVKSKIPKKPEYYLAMAKKAQELDEPYLRSVYLRCAALAKKGTEQRQINRLLQTAVDVIERQGNPEPAPVAPIPAVRIRQPAARARHNLRSDARPLRELYNIRTLKNFIVDYATKIKHKKEILYNFLKKEFDSGRKYIVSSRKFAKIKVRNRNRA